MRVGNGKRFGQAVVAQQEGLLIHMQRMLPTVMKIVTLRVRLYARRFSLFGFGGHCAQAATAGMRAFETTMRNVLSRQADSTAGENNSQPS